MSTTAEPLQLSPASANADLPTLRAELDRIDDHIHDTLIQRAQVVARIGALGVKGRTPIRPGREAAILRRLLARHHGDFPPASLALMWRELICGMTALQRPLRITVADDRNDPATLALTREHFGALVPLRAYSSPAQAIHEVSAATRHPPPSCPSPARTSPHVRPGGPPSCTATTPASTSSPACRSGPPAPKAPPRPRPSSCRPPPRTPAATTAPSSAWNWRSRPAAPASAPTSPPQASSPGPVILRRDPGAPVAHALVDVEGFVPDEDPRLATLASVLRPPVVLGAYAVPHA